MAPLLREVDWQSTSLGPPASWPQSLRSAASICLGAKYPIAIYWGQDLSLLYNEAWSGIPGEKHPWALGRPAAEVWPDIWHIVGPEFAKAMAGEGTFNADRMLPMQRYGYVEETYFNYNLSPIVAEGGRIAGVFNAGLETTARVVAERRDALHLALTAAMSRSATVDEVCAAVVRTFDDHDGEIPFAFCYLFEDGVARLASTTANATRATAPTEVPLEESVGPDPWFLRNVAVTRTPVVVSDLETLSGIDAASDWPTPTTTAVTIPVLRGGPRSLRRLLGALVVAVPPGRTVDAGTRQFHQLLSDAVANALIDARREEEERRIYAVEHQVAATLQRSLIPELPELGSGRLEARYLPGADEVEVGGDWYDAVPVPFQGVFLSIGDVVGKGVAAAAQMGQIRNALRAYVLEGFTPQGIVSRLNRVTMSMNESTFATVLGMDYDERANRLRWCRAGHLPPLVRTADGEVRFLDEGGSPPIGVFPDAVYQESVTDIGAGAVVVLYTDGLIERRDEDIDVGMERLARAVSDLDPGDERFVDLLIEACLGDDRRDDVAVLVLHT